MEKIKYCGECKVFKSQKDSGFGLCEISNNDVGYGDSCELQTQQAKIEKYEQVLRETLEDMCLFYCPKSNFERDLLFQVGIKIKQALGGEKYEDKKL